MRTMHIYQEPPSDNDINDIDDPIKVGDALSRNHAKEWKLAMEEEYKSLLENKMWSVVPRLKDRKVIDTKWLFKTKCNPDGSINKRKARFLARGFTQVPGIDFDNIYPPTVSYQALRTIIAITCQMKLELHQMDVKTRYLNGEIDKELYIEDRKSTRLNSSHL